MSFYKDVLFAAPAKGLKRPSIFRWNFRSSVVGQFITKAEAEAHPRITERERVRVRIRHEPRIGKP